MTKRPEIIDFGFQRQQSEHHFAVIATGIDEVTLVERFTYQTSAQVPVAPKVSPKAKLDRYRWSRIQGPAAEVFNERLQRDNYPPGIWKPLETVLAPHFGKELVLLAWAVEDQDSSVIPNMIANWRGLAPEERWWLYTTINATSSHPDYGKDRGWRKAIKIAFAENPTSEVQPSDNLVASSLLAGSLRRKQREAEPGGQNQLPFD